LLPYTDKIDVINGVIFDFDAAPVTNEDAGPRPILYFAILYSHVVSVIDEHREGTHTIRYAGGPTTSFECYAPHPRAFCV